MQLIKVDKAELLATLEQNRTDHQVIYQEAVNGFYVQVIGDLEERLQTLREAEVVGEAPEDFRLSRSAPHNYTREYDRVIAMIKMAVGEHISLDEQDFARYVQDDWSWQGSFLSNVYGSARARGKFSESYAVS